MLPGLRMGSGWSNEDILNRLVAFTTPPSQKLATYPSLLTIKRTKNGHHIFCDHHCIDGNTVCSYVTHNLRPVMYSDMIQPYNTPLLATMHRVGRYMYVSPLLTTSLRLIERLNLRRQCIPCICIQGVKVPPNAGSRVVLRHTKPCEDG